jgi:hypothetical protein
MKLASTRIVTASVGALARFYSIIIGIPLTKLVPFPDTTLGKTGEMPAFSATRLSAISG